MYLKKIVILNYKSCKQISLDLDKDKPNTFIGLNDSGKTTILKAIGLLLEPTLQINILGEGQNTSDFSNTCLSSEEVNQILSTCNLASIELNNSEIGIIGAFSVEEGDLGERFDEEGSEHLKWCIENSTDNTFYLFKRFNNENQKGLSYLLCPEGDGEYTQLWSQTKANLTQFIKTLGLSKEVENENSSGPFKNIEKLRAIYNNTSTSPKWTEYKDYAKKDKQFFPSFRYIDWNTSLKDVESMAKDAMEMKIQIHRESLQQKAREISESVTQEVNQELLQKASFLATELPSIQKIEAMVSFNVEEVVSDLTIYKETSDGGVRLDSQGEGLKKQIWFAFLKMTALTQVNLDEARKRYIWCFDEPEVHLYPSAQREFYEIIKKLSEGVCQTFVSTHSTIFIDRVNISLINNVSLQNKYSCIKKAANIDDIHDSLGVRNSDILFYDLFFAVEGPTEYNIFSHFYHLVKGRSLAEDAIQLVNLGGGSNWRANKGILENLLNDFKDKTDLLHFFLDSDIGQSGDNVTLLGTYDFEDSISNKIWALVVNDACGIELTDKDFEEIRSSMENEPDKKFYALLRKKISTHTANTSQIYLPGKGEELSSLLKKFVTSADDVPAAIREYFSTL